MRGRQCFDSLVVALPGILPGDDGVEVVGIDFLGGQGGFDVADRILAGGVNGGVYGIGFRCRRGSRLKTGLTGEKSPGLDGDERSLLDSRQVRLGNARPRRTVVLVDDDVNIEREESILFGYHGQNRRGLFVAALVLGVEVGREGFAEAADDVRGQSAEVIQHPLVGELRLRPLLLRDGAVFAAPLLRFLFETLGFEVGHLEQSPFAIVLQAHRVDDDRFPSGFHGGIGGANEAVRAERCLESHVFEAANLRVVGVDQGSTALGVDDADFLARTCETSGHEKR